MASQLVELKNIGKLNHWYEDVKSQKQSVLTVNEWFEQRGVNRHTFYCRFRVMMRALEDRLATKQPKCVQSAALSKPVPKSGTERATIRLRLGELEIEIPILWTKAGSVKGSHLGGRWISAAVQAIRSRTIPMAPNNS